MRIDFRKIPGFSSLYIDYIYNFDKVKDYYSIPPYYERAYEALFNKLSAGNYHREELAGVLIDQNRSFKNSPVTIESIDRLKDKNTFVIFTGQQVGLFSGPLYTIYKAMTAINLARYLTLTTPYTFLPFFWVEGEDHDFEEIRRTYYINKNNNLAELLYEPKEPFAGQNAGSIIIDSAMEELIKKWEEDTIDTEFKPKIINTLKECYAPGKTLAEAFASFMASLMGQYGLILVDPSDERLKKLAIPVYKSYVENHAASINPAIEQVNKKLEDNGYHAQVSYRPDVMGIFYSNPKRLPFIKSGDKYHLKDDENLITKDQLLNKIETEITKFSPNVLLRPQVQDYLFPTAAYVAGPSEVAYFAQYKEIYNIFKTPMPAIYPRKGLTVIESRIEKIMSKFNIRLEDIFKNRADTEKKILTDLIPENLERAISEAAEVISQKIDSLEESAAAYDQNLRPVIRKFKGKTLGELKSVESRIASAIEAKDQVVKEQLDKLYLNILPNGELQERKLNILSFYYKYYQKFIYSLMELTCCRHENNHIMWKVEQ